jgi:hypothetical protein
MDPGRTCSPNTQPSSLGTWVGATSRRIVAAGLAAIVLVGAGLRWVGAHGSFGVTELDFVTPPWTAEKTFGSDLVRSGLREVSDVLWSWSLDEATARLATVAPALAVVVIGSLVLGRTAGWRCALLMGAALAVLSHAAFSGTRINPGPWMLAAALAAVTLVTSVRTALARRVLLSGALLVLVATASPIAFVVWLAIAVILWEHGRARSGAWTVLGIWLLVGIALAFVSNEPARFFFRPWTLATAWSLGGQVRNEVALWLWALVLAGGVVAATRSGTRWLLIWFGGSVLFAAFGQYRRWILEEGTFALSVFPVFALAAVGADTISERIALKFRVGLRPVFQVLLGAVLLVGPLIVPRRADPFPREPDWRGVAEVLRANVGSGDVLITSRCRRAVVFYAPEFFRRFPEEAEPGRSLVVFPAARSGWFIAPATARLYPSWKRVEEWIAQFGVIDLSPDPGAHVLYYRREGRQFALRRAAEFSLPTNTLWRGNLLLQMLEAAGPAPALLWKVDQLVLEPASLSNRNESLLDVARKLAELGIQDRARSLARRLAGSDPTWNSAQALLAELEAQTPRGAAGR